MKIIFYKYHGLGNDFVIIDNRTYIFPKNNKALIKKLCHRNFGIGADGLILLENDNKTDFKMIYYNADGNESTMCGNGGRCIVAFAHKLGLFTHQTTFSAIDGIHYASIDKNIISLQMINVDKINHKNNYAFVNTGSPHHVELVENITTYPVFHNGKKIRNEIYGITGSNINFVEQINRDTFRVRTYERGVENETLACGTGVTAVAIVMHSRKKTTATKIKLLVEGGELYVKFKEENGKYKNIYLIGDASFVFKGTIDVFL